MRRARATAAQNLPLADLAPHSPWSPLYSTPREFFITSLYSSLLSSFVFPFLFFLLFFCTGPFFHRRRLFVSL